MSPNKQKALKALLVAPTKAEAAKAAGIDPATLRRYFQDPEFVSELKKAFSNAIDEATSYAKLSLHPALATLRRIAEDKTAPVMAQVSASRSLLEYGQKLIETNDILLRLEALEDAYKQNP